MKGYRLKFTHPDHGVCYALKGTDSTVDVAQAHIYKSAEAANTALLRFKQIWAQQAISYGKGGPKWTAEVVPVESGA